MISPKKVIMHGGFQEIIAARDRLSREDQIRFDQQWETEKGKTSPSLGVVHRTCGLCQGLGRRLSTTLSEAGRNHAAVTADIWRHLGLLYFVVLVFMACKGLNHPLQVFQDLVRDEVLDFLALSQPVDHFGNFDHLVGGRQVPLCQIIHCQVQ